MGWARMLLMGNIGQQFDIEDVESDVVSMRARLDAQSDTDNTQDQALITLRREITELKLVVAELSKLLVAGGTVSAESMERLVRGLEAKR